MSAAEAVECSLGRLTPTSETEIRVSSGDLIRVPLVRTTYPEWTGSPVADTYGGKPIVTDHRGNPAFAELAILRDLEAAGWKGVWVDSYRRRLLTDWPPAHGNLDQLAGKQFDRISQRRLGRSWDVFAWCADRVLFAESKRLSRDTIRPSQIEWLEAALDAGLTPLNFLLVEWTAR